MNKIAPLPPISGDDDIFSVPKLNIHGGYCGRIYNKQDTGITPVDGPDFSCEYGKLATGRYTTRDVVSTGRYTKRGDIHTNRQVGVSGTGIKPKIKLVLVIIVAASFVGLIAMSITLGIVLTKDETVVETESQLSSNNQTAFNNGSIDANANTFSCMRDQYKCGDDSCIPLFYKCDVFWDCNQGEDEIGCDCGSLFTCTDGSCIFNSWRCDMDNDCGDNSDEIGCVCPGRSCESNGVCLSDSSICDGIPHCDDRSDEVNCSCSELHTACDDGTCILSSWWCDGVPDCSVGEDEDNNMCGVRCNNMTEFECSNHLQCVPINHRCDNTVHCTDKSDENNCLSISNTTDSLLSIIGGVSVPICSYGWNVSWNNFVCNQLGFGSALSSGTNTATLEHTSSNGYAVAQSGTPTDSILELLTLNMTCLSGNIVSLNCKHDECGTRAKQFHESINSPAKLVHSFDAKLGYWPWQASLQYMGGHICGATLISSQWMITAAHCVEFDPNNPGYFTFRLGTTKTTEVLSTMQTVTASHIYMHPNYNTITLENDIALIKLNSSITYNDYIRPVCLPSESEDFYNSLECYTTGWGALDNKAKIYPEDLQETKMSLINDSICRSDPDISRWGLYDDIMQCAGYTHGYITVCKGDSGGPLVCRDSRHVWTLAGVVSWGPVSGDIKCMGISVYTEVTAYVNWINQIMLLS